MCLIPIELFGSTHKKYVNGNKEREIIDFLNFLILI